MDEPYGRAALLLVEGLLQIMVERDAGLGDELEGFVRSRGKRDSTDPAAVSLALGVLDRVGREAAERREIKGS